MLSQMVDFLSFLWLKKNPLYILTPFSLSIHGHFGCFHFLANVNNAAMNVEVQICL